MTPFTATLAWMHDHLHEDLTVADLADRAATSARHLACRFAAASGTTPHVQPEWPSGSSSGSKVLPSPSVLPISTPVASSC
jgi:AraC-like DNA-binding protein